MSGDIWGDNTTTTTDLIITNDGATDETISFQSLCTITDDDDGVKSLCTTTDDEDGVNKDDIGGCGENVKTSFQDSDTMDSTTADVVSEANVTEASYVIETRDVMNAQYLESLNPWKLKSSLFSGVLLAYWDNVMGPTITKLWIGNKKVAISEEMVNYIANHTLSGELCRQTDTQTIDPKLVVLKDRQWFFCAFIFNGRSKVGVSVLLCRRT